MAYLLRHRQHAVGDQTPRGCSLLALVAEGSAQDNTAKTAAPADGTLVLLQPEHDVAESYRSYGTPAAVLIGRDSRIGSGLAQGAEQIRALVAYALDAARSGARAQLTPSDLPITIGTVAPSLAFQDLDGNAVALSDFRGNRTLLIFWNPQCSFCEQMLPDLKAWEDESVPQAPALLVISRGSKEENRAMQLRSPIVLDNDHRAASAFGTAGTPMGVLWTPMVSSHPKQRPAAVQSCF